VRAADFTDENRAQGRKRLERDTVMVVSICRF
jgi:hypothetical protein